MEDVVGNLKQKLKELLEQPEEPIRFADSGTTVIMVAGVNGAGKTTSIAKLARMFKNQGKQVVLGAAIPSARRPSSSLPCGPAGWGPRSSPAKPRAIRPASPIAR